VALLRPLASTPPARSARRASAAPQAPPVQLSASVNVLLVDAVVLDERGRS